MGDGRSKPGSKKGNKCSDSRKPLSLTGRSTQRGKVSKLPSSERWARGLLPCHNCHLSHRGGGRNTQFLHSCHWPNPAGSPRTQTLGKQSFCVTARRSRPGRNGLAFPQAPAGRVHPTSTQLFVF